MNDSECVALLRANKRGMKAGWLLGFLAPVMLQAQHRLEVRVEGVESSTGLIQVALFTSHEGFLKDEGVYRSASFRAQKGTTHVLLEDLPPGGYALAIFHDLNENEKLDKNWIGIPKEPMGFSNAHVKAFGPPSFEECRIDLRQHTTIAVRLE